MVLLLAGILPVTKDQLTKESCIFLFTDRRGGFSGYSDITV